MVIKHLGTCEISGRGTANNDAAEVKELLHPRVNPLKTKDDDGGPRDTGRCGDTRSESEMLAPQAHATMREARCVRRRERLAAWDPHIGDEGTRVRDSVGGPHGGELGCASVEGEGNGPSAR
jgi:hypothetical protein